MLKDLEAVVQSATLNKPLIEKFAIELIPAIYSRDTIETISLDHPNIKKLSTSTIPWVHCPACHHKAAVAIVALIIRWGPDTPDDWVRKRLVFARCGHRGGLLYAPSWVNGVVGWQVWPDVE